MGKNANRDFKRNVLALMTGTTVAQAIPIAISPILTRIYTPAEFGAFALFVSIVSVFGAIANGCYEQAIMLPESDEDALNVMALGLVITILLSIILLLVILFFGQSIATTLGNPEIGLWLLVVPASVFFTGFNNVLVYFNSRKEKFLDIAKSTIIKSVAQSVIQVVAGFLHVGVGGLIIGQVVSLTCANVRLVRNTLSGSNWKSSISVMRMKVNAKRYNDFPKYSMPSIFANTLSLNIYSFLIARYFSVSILGHYALVQRTMTLPANLISKAVGQVFYQQASDARRKNGNAIKVFVSTFKKLSLLSVGIFSIVFFVIEDVFALVFGEDWRVAGVYAQIMIPLFAVRFVVSPLSMVTQLMLKNKVTMVINFLLLLISIAVFVVSDMLSLNFNRTLDILSWSLTGLYLIFLMMLFKFVMSDKGEAHVSEA